jgi:hypothetical protein
MADTDLITVTLDGGKYTIRQVDLGKWEVLRHGEPWPAFADGPDNLHVALAMEVDALRKLLDGFVGKVDPACTTERDHPQADLADALRAVWEHYGTADGQDLHRLLNEGGA